MRVLLEAAVALVVNPEEDVTLTISRAGKNVRVLVEEDGEQELGSFLHDDWLEELRVRVPSLRTIEEACRSHALFVASRTFTPDD